ICPLLSSFYTYPPPPEISPLSLHDALPIYSATLALRTQQILAYETGVARVADPLGGSYYVEALTDQVEARVVEIMEDLERRGGRSEEHTSELQSRSDLVCRLLLEKKNNQNK